MKKPDGFDVQFIKAVGKALNCKINISFRNWARQDEFALIGKQDILLGSMDYEGNVDYYVSDTYRHDPIGAYWNGPVASEDLNKSLKELLESGHKFGYRRYIQESPALSKALKSKRFKKQLISIDQYAHLLEHLKKNRMTGGFMHLATAEQYLKNTAAEIFI